MKVSVNGSALLSQPTAFHLPLSVFTPLPFRLLRIGSLGYHLLTKDTALAESSLGILVV